MDDKVAVYLFSLAGIMITFAGFSALLLSVRQGAGAAISRLDRFLARTIMVHVFVLLAGALLPPLLSLFGLPEAWIWRLASVLFGVPLVALQVTFPRRRRNTVGQGPPRSILAVFVVLGSVVTVSMGIYVAGAWPKSGIVYLTALTVDFFTVAFSFLTALDVILQQPLAGPERAPDSSSQSFP